MTARTDGHRRPKPAQLSRPQLAMLSLGLGGTIIGLLTGWTTLLLYAGWLKEATFEATDFASNGPVRVYTRADVPVLARWVGGFLAGGALLLFAGVRSALGSRNPSRHS